MEQPDLALSQGGFSEEGRPGNPGHRPSRTQGTPSPGKPSPGPSDQEPSPGAPGGAAPDEALGALWSELQGAIRGRVQREQFETWFRRAALRRVDDRRVVIVVQNAFTQDWLKKHYTGCLEASIKEVFGGSRQLQFEVDSELLIEGPPESAPPGASGPTEGPGPNSADAALQRTAGPPSSGRPGLLPAAPHTPQQRTQARSGAGNPPHGSAPAPQDPGDRGFGAPAPHGGSALEPDGVTPTYLPDGLLWNSDVQLNPKYRFDNYVVGPCNRFGHAAAQGVAESPGKAYNPLFLHGNVGLGKTHLLQSMCHALLEKRPGFRILYLSCETFVNHFIGALEDGNLSAFRHKYRNVDMLVVDDIHMLANKERTQEEFFHTFNTLYNASKQIVLSSDSPPKEIPTLQERLVSRFKWGLVTEVEKPCYETRMAILKRKSKDRGRELPDEVAGLLAEHIDTNIRELEGAVNRLQGYASLSGQAISADLAREVLRDVFTVTRREPSLEEVVRVVTTHFNVKLTDLQSRKRTNAIAYPRQVAQYLARKITRHSLEEIGGFFGGRDHSTVLYAVEKIDRMSKQDPAVRELLADLLGQLEVRSQ